MRTLPKKSVVHIGSSPGRSANKLTIDVAAQDFWDCARGFSTGRLQNILHKATEKAAVDRWLAGAEAEARANLHSCSGWGAGVALIRCPTERLLQLSDQEFRSAVAERLLVPRVPRVGAHACSALEPRVGTSSGEVRTRIAAAGARAFVLPGATTRSSESGRAS